MGDRWLKPVIALAACIPALRLVVKIVTYDFAADPVRETEIFTGLSTLILLFCTLAVTPVRRLTGWNALIKVRRMLGLFTFGYVLVHASMYFVFDHSLDAGEIAMDVIKHPWVMAGFTAFLLLIPLAVTSTSGWVRRLGGKRWQRLHRLVYVIGLLGVVHFLWLVKKDVREPLIYGAVLLVLLAARLWKPGRLRVRAPVAAPAGEQ